MQEIILDSTVNVQPIEAVISDALMITGLGSGHEQDNSTVSAQDASDHFSQKGAAPWGLQRIDQRQRLSTRGTSSASVNYDYLYSSPAGEGVIVYILDTGARESHNDFGGRVEMAAQFGGCKSDVPNKKTKKQLALPVV